MTVETTTIEVGREKQVELELAIYNRNVSSDSMIIFSPGGSYKKCESILNPLSEVSTVLTYNPRGARNSDGTKVNLSEIEKDLVDIIEKQPGKVVLVGHSMGTGISINAAHDNPNVNGLYLLTPYLGEQFMGRTQQTFLRVADVLRKHPTIINGIDYVMEKILGQKTGIAKPERLDNYCRSREFKKPTTTTELLTGWMIPDQDLLTGANPDKLRKGLKLIYQNGQDDSNLVKGLNHFLNITPGDRSQLLKPEEGKSFKKIIETIQEFCQKNLKN